MTNTTYAPQQIWLTGQVAAHEGPVDMMMMYVMHHAFRRDLAAFAAAVPATPVQDRESWQAMLDRWTGFARLLHHHHSGEDAGLWPLLLERVDAAGDHEARETLEAMEAEHEQIDPLLTACAAGLERMVAGGDADVRSALAVRMAAARDTLGAHLAHEETDAIALIQRHLTDEDWKRVEREHFEAPKKLGEVAFSVAWICLGLPAEVRERGFRQFGPLFRLMWLASRRRFERADRLAFRHA